MKSSTKRTILLVFAIFFVMAMFVCLFTACGGHSVGTSTGGDDNHQIYPGDNQANNPGGNQGNTPGDNQGNTPGGDQGQNNNPPENEYDNLDVISSSTYSQEGEDDVLYTYQYSLTIENNIFSLLVVIIGNDGSFRVEEKKGTIERNEETGVIALVYDDGDEPNYIKETARGFAFCNADGTNMISEDTRETHAAIEIVPRSGNSVYGYYDLSLLENGENMQALYYDMFNICEAFLASEQDLSEESKYLLYSFNLENYGVTAEDAITVWKVFYIENPWYFFMSNSLYFSKGMMLLTVDETYAKYADRAQAIRAINSMISACAEVVAEDGTELQKALAVHDFLLEQMDYAFVPGTTTPSDEIWAHNIVGSAMRNLGVCESYAKTFALLCRLQGLDCIIVTGKGGNESHAWNILNIDDVWYCVDVTWDETNEQGKISYNMFGTPYSSFSTSHTSDTNETLGIDYLYRLPFASEDGIQLVTLYEEETCLGFYGSIDLAFEAMTNHNSEYTIDLFEYNYSGVLLLSIPTVLHKILSLTTPSVAKIIITGDIQEQDYGIMKTRFLMYGNLTLKTDLEINNIYLNSISNNNDEDIILNIDKYSLITSGYYCLLDGIIIGSVEEQNESSIIVNTSYETEAYADICVHTVIGNHIVIRGDLYVIDCYGLETASFGHDCYIYIKNLYNSINDNYGSVNFECAYVAPIQLYVQIENLLLDCDGGFPVIGLSCSEYIESFPHVSITNPIDKDIEVQLNLKDEILETGVDGSENARYTINMPLYKLKGVPVLTLPHNNISQVRLAGFPYHISEDKLYVSIEEYSNGFYITGDKLWRYEGENKTNITVPDGIKEISGAFSGHSEITSITLPNSLEIIDNGALSACVNLSSICIPNNVKTIGSNVFSGCRSLTSINIPYGVTSIGNDAFFGCSNLKTIDIPNTVTSIGRCAFQYSGLTSISLPDSIASVGYNAFDNCKISNISGSAQSVAMIAENCRTNPLTVVIDSGTNISDYQFTSITNLVSITIYDGIEYIGTFAFAGCTGLKSLVIPNNVTYIGDRAFEDSGLASIEFANNSKLTCIGDRTFESCKELKELNIPNGVTSIGNFAFYGCESLTSVTIPDSVTSIGYRAFEGCTSLTSIIIPTSVTRIEDCTFEGCTGLTSIIISNSLTGIGYRAFDGCNNLQYNEYDNAKYIGNESNPYFALVCATSKNITSCSINENCKVIGNSAFAYCGKLTSITIPDNVTNIGDEAFYESGLMSVVIGSSVTSIGNCAFYCNKLFEIYNKSSLIITQDRDDNGYVAYPAKDIYTEEGGSKLSTDDNGYVIYTDGEDKILAGYIGNATELMLPNEITEIYQYSFYNCADLISITITDSVRSIGNYAFYGCTSLTSVTFMEGSQLSLISHETFYGCTGLTSIIIPNSVSAISEEAFLGCTSLTSVTFAEGSQLYFISRDTFAWCTYLTSIYIPHGVTIIYERAFYECSSLITINYEGTIEQWNAVEKVDDWDYNTGDYVIHCTDGDIAKGD